MQQRLTSQQSGASAAYLLGKAEDKLLLKLPVEVLGIQSKEGEKLSLNPENNLILTPTDHIVYMSRKRFDWLKNSGQIMQHIAKML